jgi:hypothetical protein
MGFGRSAGQCAYLCAGRPRQMRGSGLSEGGWMHPCDRVLLGCCSTDSVALANGFGLFPSVRFGKGSCCSG